MVRCEYCGEEIDSLPFRCKYCDGTYCVDHHLPENHACENLPRGNVFTALSTPRPKKRSSRVEFVPHYPFPSHVPVTSTTRRPKGKSYSQVVWFSVLLFIVVVLLFFWRNPEQFEGIVSSIEENVNSFFFSDPSLSQNSSLDVSENTNTHTTPKINLFSGPETRTLFFTLYGKRYLLNFTVYRGAKEYFASLPRSISYVDEPPTEKDFAERFILNPTQDKLLSPLVESISSFAKNDDEAARIAISLVQHIPYDYSFSEDQQIRFPYEVIYDNKGVCGEKSYLLAYLLKKLGFGVVLFEFERENHRAVGIKCSPLYGAYGTEYCFVETTRPSIITDTQGNYQNVGKLSTPTKIIHIADGKAIDASREYRDAQAYNRYVQAGKVRYLSKGEYNHWRYLVSYYDLDFPSSTS